MKKIITKIIGAILLSPLLVYIVLIFSFGGLGKKPVTDLAFLRGDSMLLFAHRGILNYFPEHSREGANAALQIGFNAIEIDIRKTADNELIVFHDENADRLLGINIAVDSLNTTQIKNYPLHYYGRKTSNRVQTVNEFLSDYKKDFVIYCDMKFSGFKDADAIVRLIKSHSAEGSCIIASADVVFIFYVEMMYPNMLTALEGFDPGKEWTYFLIPEKIKPDFLSGFFQNINKSHVDWLKKNDIMPSRIVYGIDKTNYADAKKYGIKNFILDYDSSMKDIRIDIHP